MSDEHLAHTLAMREAHAQRLAESLYKQYSPFRSMPARDAAGVLMLGFDRRVERDGISRVEADYLLANDVRKVLISLRGLLWGVQDLCEIRQAVIANVAMVLGLDRVRAMHGLWDALRRRDYIEAADQILLSDWPTHVGHTLDERRRAIALCNAMRTGVLRGLPKESTTQ